MSPNQVRGSGLLVRVDPEAVWPEVRSRRTRTPTTQGRPKLATRFLRCEWDVLRHDGSQKPCGGGDQPPHSRHHHGFRHCFTLFTECFAPFDRSTSALSVPVAMLRRSSFPTAGRFMLHYQAALLQGSGVVAFGGRLLAPTGCIDTGLSPCSAQPPFQVANLSEARSREPHGPRRPCGPTHHNTGGLFCGVVRRKCRWFRGGQDLASSVAPTRTITVVFDSSAE